MNFSTLALAYTYKCTAFCQHCCCSCGPSNGGKIPYEKAVSLIREASGIDNIRRIAITGGEPFLYFDEIVRLCSYSTSLGLDFGCITNCYWATTKPKAKEGIRALHEAGLRRLSLSCDPSHQRFVPIRNVQNVVDTALEYDIDVVISVNFLPWENDPGQRITIPLSNRFKIVYGPVIPVGRARQLHLKGSIPIETMSQRTCQGLTQLVVGPDMLVLPCCGIGGFTNPLVIGSAETESLTQLIEMAKRKGLFRIIEYFGFDKLLSHASKLYGDITIPSRFISICHLCYELLSNPLISAEISEIVDSFETEYLNRFLAKLEMFKSAGHQKE